MKYYFCKNTSALPRDALITNDNASQPINVFHGEWNDCSHIFIKNKIKSDNAKNFHALKQKFIINNTNINIYYHHNGTIKRHRINILKEKPNECHQLINAVKNGELNTVRTLLQNHPDIINVQDASGFTAIHYAVYFKKIEIVKLLISANIDIDVGAHLFKKAPRNIKPLDVFSPSSEAYNRFQRVDVILMSADKPTKQQLQIILTAHPDTLIFTKNSKNEFYMYEQNQLKKIEEYNKFRCNRKDELDKSDLYLELHNKAFPSMEANPNYTIYPAMEFTCEFYREAGHRVKSDDCPGLTEEIASTISHFFPSVDAEGVELYCKPDQDGNYRIIDRIEINSNFNATSKVKSTSDDHNTAVHHGRHRVAAS